MFSDFSFKQIINIGLISLDIFPARPKDKPKIFLPIMAQCECYTRRVRVRPSERLNLDLNKPPHSLIKKTDTNINHFKTDIIGKQKQ